MSELDSPLVREGTLDPASAAQLAATENAQQEDEEHSHHRTAADTDARRDHDDRGDDGDDADWPPSTSSRDLSARLEAHRPEPIDVQAMRKAAVARQSADSAAAADTDTKKKPTRFNEEGYVKLGLPARSRFCGGLLLQDKLRNNVRSPALLGIIYVVAALLVGGIIALSLNVDFGKELTASFSVMPPSSVVIGQEWPYFAAQLENSNGLPVKNAWLELQLLPLGELNVPVMAKGNLVVGENIQCISTPFAPLTPAALQYPKLCNPGRNGALNIVGRETNDLGAAGFKGVKLSQGAPGTYLLLVSHRSEQDLKDASEGKHASTAGCYAFVEVKSAARKMEVSNQTLRLPRMLSIGDDITTTVDFVLDPTAFISPQEIYSLEATAVATGRSMQLPYPPGVAVSADWLSLHGAASIQGNRAPQLPTSTPDPEIVPIGTFDSVGEDEVNATISVELGADGLSGSVSLLLSARFTARLVGTSKREMFFGVLVWGTLFVLTPEYTLTGPAMVPDIVIPPVAVRPQFDGLVATFHSTTGSTSASPGSPTPIEEGVPFKISVETTTGAFVNDAPCYLTLQASTHNPTFHGPSAGLSPAGVPKSLLAYTGARHAGGVIETAVTTQGVAGLYDLYVSCGGVVAEWRDTGVRGLLLNVTTISGLRVLVQDPSIAANASIPIEVLGLQWVDPPRVQILRSDGSVVPGKFAELVLSRKHVAPEVEGTLVAAMSLAADNTGWVMFEITEVVSAPGLQHRQNITVPFDVLVDGVVEATIWRVLVAPDSPQAHERMATPMSSSRRVRGSSRSRHQDPKDDVAAWLDAASAATGASYATSTPAHAPQLRTEESDSHLHGAQVHAPLQSGVCSYVEFLEVPTTGYCGTEVNVSFRALDIYGVPVPDAYVLLEIVNIPQTRAGATTGPDGIARTTGTVPPVGAPLFTILSVKCNESTGFAYTTRLSNLASLAIVPRGSPVAKAVSVGQGNRTINVTFAFPDYDPQLVTPRSPVKIEAVVAWSSSFSSWYYPVGVVQRVATVAVINSTSEFNRDNELTFTVSQSAFTQDLIAGPRLLLLLVDGYPVPDVELFVPSPTMVDKLEITRSAFEGYSVQPTPLYGRRIFGLGNHSKTVDVITTGLNFRDPFRTQPVVRLLGEDGAPYTKHHAFILAQLGATRALVDPTDAEDAKQIHWTSPIANTTDTAIGILSSFNEEQTTLANPVTAPSNQTDATAVFSGLGVLGANTSYFFYVRYCFYVSSSSGYAATYDGATVCVNEKRVLRFLPRLQPSITVQGAPLTLTTLAGSVAPPFEVKVDSPNAQPGEAARLHLLSAFGTQNSGFVNTASNGYADIFNGTTYFARNIMFFIAAAPAGAVPISVISAGCSTTITVIISNAASGIVHAPVPPAMTVGRPVSLDLMVRGTIGGESAGHLLNKLVSITAQRIVDNSSDSAQTCEGPAECGVLAPMSTTFGSTGTGGLLTATLEFAEAKTGNYTFTVTVVDSETDDARRQLLRRSVLHLGGMFGVPLAAIPEFEVDEPGAGATAALDAAAILAVAEAQPVAAHVSNQEIATGNALVRQILEAEFRVLERLVRGITSSSKSEISATLGPIEVRNPVARIELINADSSVRITKQDYASTIEFTNVEVAGVQFPAPLVKLLDEQGRPVEGATVTVNAVHQGQPTMSTGDLGVRFYWPAHDATELHKLALPSESAIAAESTRTFPVSDPDGIIDLTGLVLLPSRSGEFLLQVSSRGSAAAISTGVITVDVVALSLVQSLKIFAFIFAVLFTPLFAANVPGSGEITGVLASIIASAGCVLLLVEAAKHRATFVDRPFQLTYVSLTVGSVVIATLTFLLFISRGFSSNKARGNRISRSSRSKSTWARYFSKSAYEGEGRAYDVFQYARWITTASITRQVVEDRTEQVRLAEMPEKDLPCATRVGIRLRAIKDSMNKFIDVFDLHSHEKVGDRLRTAVAARTDAVGQARAEIALEDAAGPDGIVETAEPRPPLRRPEHVPSACFLPANFVIVVAFAIVFAILGSMGAWYLFVKLSGWIVRLINCLPDSSEISPQEANLANFALTESLSLVVSGLSAQFPKFGFLASMAQHIKSVNVVRILNDVRRFLRDFITYLEIAFAVGTAVAVLAMIVTFAVAFKRVPVILRRLRRGELREVDSYRNPPVATLEAYIGQHLFMTAALFAIAFVLTACAVLIITIPIVRDFLLQQLLTAIAVAIGSFIVAWVLRQTVMRGLTDGWLVQRPAFHALYSFLDLLLGLFHSVMAPLVRWGQAVVWFTLSFANLEVSVFPTPFDRLDTATGLFRATLGAEAKYGNPIVLAFVSSLVLDRALKRAAAVKMLARAERLKSRGSRAAGGKHTPRDEDEASMVTTDDGTAAIPAASKMDARFGTEPKMLEEDEVNDTQSSTLKVYADPKALSVEEERDVLERYRATPMARILVFIEEFTRADPLMSARIESLLRIWLRSYSRVDTDLAVWPYRDCTDSDNRAHSSSDDDDFVLSPRTRAVSLRFGSEEEQVARQVDAARQRLRQAEASGDADAIADAKDAFDDVDAHHKRFVFSRVTKALVRPTYFFDVLGYLRRFNGRTMVNPRVPQRWWLYVILSRNPSLRMYRKNRIKTVLLAAARAAKHNEAAREIEEKQRDEEVPLIRS